MDDLKSTILQWNNLFPFDKEFRDKYSIAFNSKKHRNLCQIDVFLDIIEDRVLEVERNEFIERYKKLVDYENNGQMFVFSKKQEDDRFNKFLPKDSQRFIDVNDLDNV